MTAGVGAWVVPQYYSLVQPMLGSSAYPEAHRERVNFAVQGIQRELDNLLYEVGPIDGIFGSKTSNAVKTFQKDKGLVVDGIFGRKSAIKLFYPIINKQQKERGVPDNLLAGQLFLESAFDTGAQGRVDNRDRGIAQINSYWHPSISDYDAYARPRFCIVWTCSNLMLAFKELQNWDAAVAYHNSPSKAKQWAKNGYPPDDQIAKYVELVKKMAEQF